MRLIISLTTALILCVFLFVGCNKDDDNPVTVAATETILPTYQPKGTITGLIKDVCTNEAIKGAVLSLSYNGTVQSVQSDEAGQFSFDNVPAGQFKVISGALVATGTYTITASLVDYNKSVSDTTKRYRNYYYNTTTITFTSLVPGDSLGVSGLVGSVIFEIAQLNTSLVGEVVDEKMQPVSGARVVLFDASITHGVVLQQTQTDANGRYRFSALDNGMTVRVMARSADGKYEGSLPSLLSLPCNLYYDSLRSNVTAERIQLQWANNVPPYVIDITPKNNADVSPTNLQIVYTFSAPIKQTEYTRTDLGKGHGTILDDISVVYTGMKKTAGTIGHSVSWNSTMTQLTITPSGVVGSARYTVSVSTALPKLTDEAGLAVVNNTALIGDFETLNLTTNGQSTVPGAPVLTRRLVPGYYDILNYNGGTVALEWTADANARSYNLYRQIGDGPFEILQSNIYNLMTTDLIGTLVTPNAADPLAAITVKYRLTAVSKDLVEGPPSNVVTVSDNVRPQLLGATPMLLSTRRYQLILRFSEPLAMASAQNTDNYLIQNPDTVVFSKQQAAYLGFNSVTNRYEVALTVAISNGDNLPAGLSIRAGSNIVDLAGNSIDTVNHTYTFSAPPAPTLASPADGATNVAATAALSWNPANGATSYTLQISTNAGFTAIVAERSNITSTSFSLGSITGLVSGTTYYWRVLATNAAGSSAYSTARSFTLQ